MMRLSANRHLKAASWYTVSTFVAKSLLYILTPLYTRVLTTWEFGQYNNFLSWQHILAAIISFDLSSTIAIAYIDYKDRGLFEDYVSTISITGVILPSALSLVLILTHNVFESIFNMDLKYMVLMLIGISFGSTLAIFQEENRQKLNYKLSSLLTIIGSCTSIPIILFLIFVLENNLDAILIGSLITNVGLNLITLLLILHRKVAFNVEFIRYSLKIAIPLIPHILAANVLGSSDKIMITEMCGNEKTALYSVVFTCSMVLNVFVSSFNNATIPWYFEKIKEDNISSIHATSKTLICIISFLCINLCLLSPEIVLVLGGKKYMEAVVLMPPIILSCLIRYIYTFYVNIEYYNKRTIGISIGTVFVSVLNIVLNYYGIKIFGYSAAAYATLIVSIMLLFIHVSIVRRQKSLLYLDNRFNIIALLVVIPVALSVLATYQHTLLRYSIFFVEVCVCVIIVLKRKDSILPGIFNK